MSERELRNVMKAYASAPPAGMFGNIMGEVKARRKARRSKPYIATACAAALVGVLIVAPILGEIWLEPLASEPLPNETSRVFAGGDISLHIQPTNAALTHLGGLNEYLVQPISLPSEVVVGGSSFTIAASAPVEIVHVPGGEVVRIYLTADSSHPVELIRAPGDRAMSLLPRRDASYTETEVLVNRARAQVYLSDMTSRSNYAVWQQGAYSFLLNAGRMSPEEIVGFASLIR